MPRPGEVVDFHDGDRNNLQSENLFLRPRHGRSVGRRGGLEAERNRDKATLCVFVSNPEATMVESR
jgi:hypothetical protein